MGESARRTGEQRWEELVRARSSFLLRGFPRSLTNGNSRECCWRDWASREKGRGGPGHSALAGPPRLGRTGPTRPRADAGEEGRARPGLWDAVGAFGVPNCRAGCKRGKPSEPSPPARETAVAPLVRGGGGPSGGEKGPHAGQTLNSSSNLRPEPAVRSCDVVLSDRRGWGPRMAQPPRGSVSWEERTPGTLSCVGTATFQQTRAPRRHGGGWLCVPALAAAWSRWQCAHARQRCTPCLPAASRSQVVRGAL